MARERMPLQAVPVSMSSILRLSLPRSCLRTSNLSEATCTRSRPARLQHYNIQYLRQCQHHSRASAYRSLSTKTLTSPAQRQPTIPTRGLARAPDLQRSELDPAVFVAAAVFAAGLSYLAERYYYLNEPQPTQEVHQLDYIDNMSATNIAPGRPGNLTLEQEAKLKEMWTRLLEIFATALSDSSTPSAATTDDVDVLGKKKKRSRLSLFGGKSKRDIPAEDSEADKHNQSAAFEAALTSDQPSQLRAAFWDLVKHDNPDAIVLRYLRARKWDVHNAIVMLVSTLHWTLGVDPYDTIVAKGEGDAFYQSNTSTGQTQKDGQEFMDICHAGKSFIHGHDLAGRPVVYIRARLHRSGQQSDCTMERFTIYTIETTRLFLTPQVDTATLVFDMTNFTLANMDYAPVKFMIKCFEANYPESLGSVVVYKSPLIFQGIWKVIKGWLDPVVASKIHFESSPEALEKYIGPKPRIMRELGGEEDFEYKYIEPKEGENDVMKDTKAREQIREERKGIQAQYERATAQWANVATASDRVDRRTPLAAQLTQNYWRLDPYVRARTLYDRIGILKAGGQFEYFPDENGSVKA